MKSVGLERFRCRLKDPCIKLPWQGRKEVFLLSVTIVERVVIQKISVMIKIVAVIVEIGIIQKMIVVRRIFTGVTRRAHSLDLRVRRNYQKDQLELFTGKKVEIKGRSIGMN